MTNRIGPVDQASIGKVGNKIDDTSTTKKVSGDQASAASSAAGKSSSNDTVELTSSAKLLERLEKTLATLPEIDASRVSEVKSAIANGNFEIDAGAIADAMIKFERSLGD